MKILWDINVQCDNVIPARRADIIVIDKEKKEALIVDIAVPADIRVAEKEKEKIEKYQDLRIVRVVIVVLGALGCVTKEFERWLENLNIEPEVGVMQKAALLGTARILRKVLEV